MSTSIADIAKVVDRWRASPLLFVKEALQAEPSKQQAAALKAFAVPGARVAIKSGHGTGKSTLMAWLIHWALVCFYDLKAPTTAPTAHQLTDVLWAEIRKWGDRLPEPWKSELDITVDMVKYKGCPGYAVARTGRKENPEALQGFHAKNLMFFVDEASGIDNVVFEVAQGALSTEGARILMAANPTRTSGYFYDAFHKNRDRWQTFTFSCLESPHVAANYPVEIAKAYGEKSDIYKVRVLGEFPSGGDMQFIPSDLVEKALSRHLSKDVYDFAPVILGVDVARYGGDRSVIFLRQGLYSNKLWERVGIDLMSLADVVAQHEDEYHASAVMIDATGVGAGVVDRLRQLGRSPIAVELGGASALNNCLNKRVECWWRLRDWLREGGVIPDVVALRDDLTAPEYQYNVKGLCQLEKKEDMRRRGIPSPDLADALALTFAAPVTKIDESRIYDMPEDVYDPLAL